LVLLKQRLISPQYLINIKDLKELDYINYDEKFGIRIGALTTHRSIETSPVVKKRFSVLSEVERNLASVQIRNWGTIGGNICHADPASDIVPPLISLDARVKVKSLLAIREIPLHNLFKDYYETTLRVDELVTEICIPDVQNGTGVANSKFSLRRFDMAVAGVAVSITINLADRICKDIRIIVGGVSAVPRRVFESENAMRGNNLAENLIREAAMVASEEVDPVADVHFSRKYKREIVKILVRDVITQAIQKASGI